MSEFKHVIWSDINLDLEDWRESLEELYPNYADDELYEIMCKTNSAYLEDERANLNVQLSQPILVIADLGLWNGRRSGYREIPSGKISDCLYTEMDYAEWYIDKNGDLKCDAVHHDGTNHYLYRVYKDNVTEDQIYDLKEKLYEGTATRRDITRITRRLGDDIANVYGFEIPKQKIKNNEAR